MRSDRESCYSRLVKLGVSPETADATGKYSRSQIYNRLRSVGVSIFEADDKSSFLCNSDKIDVDIVFMIIEGFTYSHICDTLHISSKTISCAINTIKRGL
jgi:hypothetical protein